MVKEHGLLEDELYNISLFNEKNIFKIKKISVLQQCH